MPDSIPLDDPDDAVPDGELEFPPITPQTYRDPYTDVNITFTAEEQDTAKFVLVQGDPNGESFHRYVLDVDEAFLFALADDLITPLREFRAMEQAEQAARREREQQREQEKLDTYAFRANHFGLTQARDYELVVHRRDCRHALDVPTTKGKRGTGGLGRAVFRDDLPLSNGVRVRELLTRARTIMNECVSVRHVKANAGRVQSAARGRTRDTALNHKPLRFCGTCKPLGDQSAAITARAAELATMTEFSDSATLAVHDLFTTIDTLLWETEQEHLTALQGKGNEDNA